MDRTNGFQDEAELDDLLDEAGFAADGDDPGEYGDDDQAGDVTEADLIGAGAAGPDAAYPDDPASYPEAPAPADQQGMNQYLLALEADRAARIRESEALRTQMMAQRLESARQQMTQEEWGDFRAKVAAQYALTANQQLRQVQEQQRAQQVWAAENDARNYAIRYLRERMDLDDTELALIQTAQTAGQMRDMVNVFKQDRRIRAESDRGDIRNRRAASGADLAGGRGSGGARPRPQAFRNVDELVDSIFQ